MIPRKRLFISLLFVFALMLNVSAEVDLANVKINTTPVANSKELVEQADLIVYGRPNPPEQQVSTSQTIESFHVVHFVQLIHVEKNIKGIPPDQLKLIIPGLVPLPNTTNPLNMEYPGPLAEENYVFFLKKLPDTNFYTMIGGWQGVYPLFEGKTVALEGFGFNELNGLTLSQFEKKTKEMHQ